MTDELQFSGVKLAVLREAVDRADTLSAVQAKLIETQSQMIEDLRAKVSALQSECSELKTCLSLTTYCCSCSDSSPAPSSAL